MALSGRIADYYWFAGGGRAPPARMLLGGWLGIGAIAVGLGAGTILVAAGALKCALALTAAWMCAPVGCAAGVVWAVERRRRAGVWGGRHGRLPLLEWPDAYIPRGGWGAVKRTRDSSNVAPYGGCGLSRAELEEIARTRKPNLHEAVCSRCGRYAPPGTGAVFFGMFAHRRCFAAWVAPAGRATKLAQSHSLRS